MIDNQCVGKHPRWPAYLRCPYLSGDQMEALARLMDVGAIGVLGRNSRQALAYKRTAAILRESATTYRPRYSRMIPYPKAQELSELFFWASIGREKQGDLFSANQFRAYALDLCDIADPPFDLPSEF